MSKKNLATRSIQEALRTRYRVGAGLTDAVGPIDAAERLGVWVWFRRIGSVEGILVKTARPRILLSSQRPSGRINFTCAHELGHFVLEHQGSVDTGEDGPMLKEESDDEFQANVFASYFLMPKTAVQSAFAVRGTSPTLAPPRVVLSVASWLGVGYSTLVYHLLNNLSLIDEKRSKDLMRLNPRDIVSGMIGRAALGASNFIIDSSWNSRSIDVEVGDVVVAEEQVELVGKCIGLKLDLSPVSVVEAICPGNGYINTKSGWSVPVRVKPYQFEGRAKFRYLEQDEDE